MKALAPGFLIAMPQLLDPNFKRTVVLMIEHGEHGSMGLVINRRTTLSFSELGKSQHLEVAASLQQQRVYTGGPVEPFRGFVLHDSPAISESSEVVPGLFLSVTSDSLEPLLRDGDSKLRFVLGYAGWGPGQIERELSEGSWLFTEASSAPVLETDPEALWADTIKSMGVDPAMLVTTGGIN